MADFDYVVIGAGVSGLGFANYVRERNANARVLVIEREHEPGGYCRTVKRDGFVWDYSGHFFHFKHADIEAWLRARMTGEVRTIAKQSFIRYAGRDIDFPFQKNIHQLPQDEFIECLYDVYFAARHRSDTPPGSFLEMLYQRLGRSIVDKFLRPYNEKLYATDLNQLDPDAMGRFFPHANLDDIIANMRAEDKDGGYNATFTYPEGGAMEYVNALLRDVAGDVALDEAVTSVDHRAHTVTTTKRKVSYEHLVSSAPLPKLLGLCDITQSGWIFTSNKVLVFNLGFDRKGQRGVHWMYFPNPSLSFYRVGWYDNIFDTDRMSLYVEIGLPHDAEVDVPAMRARVLADLAREKIIDGHELVAHHDIVLDPAYVHITKHSLESVAQYKQMLAAKNIHTVGRYGGWTYCSIEDNLVEVRALASELTRAR